MNVIVIIIIIVNRIIIIISSSSSRTACRGGCGGPPSRCVSDHLVVSYVCVLFVKVLCMFSWLGIIIVRLICVMCYVCLFVWLYALLNSYGELTIISPTILSEEKPWLSKKYLARGGEIQCVVWNSRSCLNL